MDEMRWMDTTVLQAGDYLLVYTFFVSLFLVISALACRCIIPLRCCLAATYRYYLLGREEVPTCFRGPDPRGLVSRGNLEGKFTVFGSKFSRLIF
jgi:hypothetical protein